MLACRYRVRVAVVDLDKPPAWWQGASARSHLTADDARQLAGTIGEKLLAHSSLSGAQDITQGLSSSDSILEHLSAALHTRSSSALTDNLFRPWL